MAYSASVDINPSLGIPPRCKGGDEAMGSAGYFGTEEKYSGRLDFLDLLYQECAASLLIIMVRLAEKASRLFTAREKTNEPVGAKTLRRARAGLKE
jgi:hypothetical protein